MYLYHALLYLEPKHGLLASTFKVLIGLPLVILLARQEKQDMMKNTLVTSVRARTLPSQNACRVKADAWVLLIDEDFRCLSLFGVQPLWLYLCKT